MARGITLVRLVRARDYLHSELCNQPTLDDLARAAGLSRAHLAREFAATFGRTPHQYLVRLRLDLARRQLAHGASVTDVCVELGFASLGSFSSSFRRHTGLSPRAWQQRARPFIQSAGVPRWRVPTCFFAAYAAHV